MKRALLWTIVLPACATYLPLGVPAPNERPNFTYVQKQAGTERDKDCDFILLKQAPEGQLNYLGTVKLETFSHSTTDTVVFKQQIHRLVCEAGGEIAVAKFSPQGAYVGADVFGKRAAE